MIECPRSIRETLVEAARRGAPEEVCGVLGGSFDPEESRIESAHPAANAATDPRRRYEIDPEAALEVFETLEARGEDVVGFYHSHPEGPPTPSETDVSSATWPDRSYVIVSLATPEPVVGSWRWREGAFERERIVLE